MSTYSYAKACATTLFLLAILKLVVSASPETDNSMVPYEHWSVKAMDYLVETGICDKWVQPDEDAKPVGNSRYRSYMAKMTVEALKGIQARLENDEPIPGAAWLMLEGLAAQYADELAEQGIKAEDVIVISRFKLNDYRFGFDSLIEIPDDHWLSIGPKTITMHKMYPDSWPGGRTYTRYEAAMLVLRSLQLEKESVEQGAVVEPGRIVMYESLLGEVALEMVYLGESPTVWQVWLRSQPEYPSYLLDDEKR